MPSNSRSRASSKPMTGSSPIRVTGVVIDPISRSFSTAEGSSAMFRSSNSTL